MAKIKLARFEIVALRQERKKIVEYLQRKGVTHLENVPLEDGISKYDSSESIEAFEKGLEVSTKALEIVEKERKKKKTLASFFNDYVEIDYDEYRQLSLKASSILKKCTDICSFAENYESNKAEIERKRNLIDSLKPWKDLDIPLGSRATAQTNIFIGTFKGRYSKEQLKKELLEKDSNLSEVEISVVHCDDFQSCVVVMCHRSVFKKTQKALSLLSFEAVDSEVKKIPKAAISDFEAEIESLKKENQAIQLKISDCAAEYEDIRFLNDYFNAALDRSKALELSGQTKSAVCFVGYVPERYSEELKFEVERKFTAELELSSPDYENDDVPVLIKNTAFASSVEKLTQDFSVASNKDIDPSFITAVFYFLLFGIMLSDAGYGLLLVLIAVILKYKFKPSGEKKKFVDFVLYCGISSTAFGILFGGFFGNVISVFAESFLGVQGGIKTALWLEKGTDTVKMLLLSFAVGAFQMLVGLAIRFYTLIKQKKVLAAFCDVVPVCLIVFGVFILGVGVFVSIQTKIKIIAAALSILGAVLTILTSGRSSENILGKLCGGLYGLYSSLIGTAADLLSYSRLLVLTFVSAAFANVVNTVASSGKNIIIFFLIFAVGHFFIFAMNLFGAYVYTNRLQFAHFFSKFYQGGGKTFTAYKINSKYFKFKEETINE